MRRLKVLSTTATLEFSQCTGGRPTCIHVKIIIQIIPISGTRILRLLWVRNYLNNYFAMNKSLTRSRTHMELASPAYLGLGII